MVLHLSDIEDVMSVLDFRLSTEKYQQIQRGLRTSQDLGELQATFSEAGKLTALDFGIIHLRVFETRAYREATRGLATPTTPQAPRIQYAAYQVMPDGTTPYFGSIPRISKQVFDRVPSCLTVLSSEYGQLQAATSDPEASPEITKTLLPVRFGSVLASVSVDQDEPLRMYGSSFFGLIWKARTVVSSRLHLFVVERLSGANAAIWKQVLQKVDHVEERLDKNARLSQYAPPATSEFIRYLRIAKICAESGYGLDQALTVYRNPTANRVLLEPTLSRDITFSSDDIARLLEPAPVIQVKKPRRL